MVVFCVTLTRQRLARCIRMLVAHTADGTILAVRGESLDS